ncbi:thiolase family protein [Desulfoferrobacter suflitae]|uniref:thiolase family protein n=1 Tax=Desulfoferrobacter suflitae TaxID=2865782 RepID=UPI0021646F9E|nr:thiolase family protein [Desulfoferrobacter suflitae]MCK8602787.1 thiolase family protein [Desulfoferrobacter suflitae]
MKARDVVVVDGIRTAFGRAGEKGFFWQTRADDMVVRVIRELLRRNPQVKPEMVEENVWGATTQEGDQGLTLGRTSALLAGLPDSCSGFSVDRMCAGGLTAITSAASEIAFGACDIAIAGGVEHMGHHPMGATADPNPRFLTEKLVSEDALVMGKTAENLHDMFPDITKEMADEYACHSQMKTARGYAEGKIQQMIAPMTVYTKEGWVVADRDQQPRPETTMEGLRSLKTPFRVQGKVTAGNASGLNDGACGVLLMAADKARELNLAQRMRLIGYAYAGVKPEIMGYGPVPATQKLFARTGLSMDDMDFVEMNEAFAVQCIVFMREFGLKFPDDPKLNPWGGAIAFGHPLAASGPRLVTHLAHLFAAHPEARYGLTTLCVGLGQGASAIWENLQEKPKKNKQRG